MRSTPLADWKSIPQGERIVELQVANTCVKVGGALEALQMFCRKSSALVNDRLLAVVRSKRFVSWLSFNPGELTSPLKCSPGLYVESNQAKSTNLLRLALLAEALGLTSQCSIGHEVHGVDAPNALTQLEKKRVFKITDDELRSVRLKKLLIGTWSAPATNWNDCIVAFASYMRTAIPFGETLAPVVPNNVRDLGPLESLACFRKMVLQSCLDRYSIWVECETDTSQSPGPLAAPPDLVGPATLPPSPPHSGKGDGDWVMVSHTWHRHFQPIVYVSR